MNNEPLETTSDEIPETVEMDYDPVFIHARREAIIIFCTWAAGLLWAVPYCYLNGYNIDDPSQITTVFGIPSWLFWGIVVPWIVANLFTTWFCFGFMKDAELVDGPAEGSEFPLEPVESNE